MRAKQLLFTLAALAVSSSLSAAILPLAQVKKGMKGYGLTVLEGTKSERFDVEILGVLTNVGPRQNIILARVAAPALATSGVIAGMSGSPIYIDGKIVGALAYSWQFSKAPIAGITPIEEMLQLERSGGNGAATQGGSRMAAGDFLKMIVDRDPARLETALSKMSLARTPVGGALPIATPLSLSRFAPETLSRFSSILESAGFISVPSGSSGQEEETSGESALFEPGDSVGAVLLDGDFSVAANGTVTHVDGDRVYGFGHPFLDMGAIDFPMAKAEVVTVLPSVAQSFKFANSGKIVGAFRQDRAAGILGYVGASADMIPVELTLDGESKREVYHFRSVRHPQLFPLIIALAADSVVSSTQRAAGERTVILESEINVAGFPPIRLRDGWAGASARQAIPAYLAVVSSYLLSNEFHDAAIESVKIHLRHDDKIRIAKLLEASIDTLADGEVNPGDTVTVRALLKPFRGEAFTESFEVEIPETTKEGHAYLFIGSGSAANQLDFYLVPPNPQTLGQVIAVVERLKPSTDLTVGLYAKSEGAVLAGVFLPNLPPSIQAIVSDDSSNAASSPVKYHASQQWFRSLDSIIDGSLKIELAIKNKL